MSNPTILEQNMAQLKRDGFLLIPQALDLAVVEQWKKVLYDAGNSGQAMPVAQPACPC